MTHPGQWLTNLGGPEVKSGVHSQPFSANDITKALNLGGPSGPVTDKLRWSGGQIRWLRANGPVLTTSLKTFIFLRKKTFISDKKTLFWGNVILKPFSGVLGLCPFKYILLGNFGFTLRFEILDVGAFKWQGTWDNPSFRPYSHTVIMVASSEACHTALGPCSPCLGEM